MEPDSQVENELKTLDTIFKGGTRVFRIPDYQRGYSWETQQCADLLKDIEYLIKSRYEGREYCHYTGTIVASKSRTESGDGEYEVFDIVDGQQRVTSLILLLSVICRKLKESNPESKTEHEVFTKFIHNRRTGNTVHKLELGKDYHRFFKSLLAEGKSDHLTESTPSKSVDNLVDAVNQYDSWLENRNIDDVLDCIRKNLGFLFYAPENDKEIGIMFEVINNRGKPLSELEKIKNYLIYYAEKNHLQDIKNLVNESWPDILRNLNRVHHTSNEDENRFLRNCWIVFWDANKSKSHHVYDNLKECWPPEATGGEDVDYILKFIEFLKDASLCYTRYLKGDGVEDEDERNWLGRISFHPADASIMPLILSILSCKNISKDDRKVLLELLEKLNFRYYGTGIAGRSDSGQGELFYLAHIFYNRFGKLGDGEEDGKIIDAQWLKDKLTKFIQEQANDGKFIEYLTLDKDEAGDYYHWAGLKFFLANYEQFLQAEQKKSKTLHDLLITRNEAEEQNDFYHREHIWAVNEKSVIDDSKHLDVNKRRLGNFLLLNEGLNITVGKKRIEEKIELYFDIEKNTPNTLMIRELEEFYKKAIEDEGAWGRRTSNYWLNIYKRFFDMREEKMINFALDRWRVSSLDDNISEVRLDSLGSDNQIYKPHKT